jgi:hypothetical protein
MKKVEAQDILLNAINCYLEDCVSDDKEEQKRVRQAWVKLTQNQEMTIKVPLEEDELERMQHEGEEFEWNFPTEEDDSQTVTIIVSKREDE